MQETNEIIKAIYEGDDRVFKQVYFEHRTAFERFIKRKYPHLSKDEEAVSTIYQDTMFRFCNNIKDGKLVDLKKAALRTYLFEIGKNLALIHYRKLTKHKERYGIIESIDNQQLTVDAAVPIEISEQRQLGRQLLLKGLDQLDEKGKEIIKRKYLLNHSDEAIGAAMGYPSTNAVTKKKERDLKKLAKLIPYDRIIKFFQP